MKTKHYLIVSGAVAIGIIIGITISTGLMKRQHLKMMSNHTEMQMGDEDFGRFHQNRQGKYCRGMQRGNRNGMGKTGNPIIFHQNLVSQLNLTEGQKTQLEDIFFEIEKERDQIQNVRESRWAATQVEIKSVLNEDQIEKMEEIVEVGGPPRINSIIRQLSLNDDQEKKIIEIWDRNREMSAGSQEARQSRHEENLEKIKSILSEEQLQEFEVITESRPCNKRMKGRRGRL